MPCLLPARSLPTGWVDRRRLQAWRTLGPWIATAIVGVGAGGCTAGLDDAVAEPAPIDEKLMSRAQGIVSCRGWIDTGYVRGAPFLINVVLADDKPVETRTANAYVSMQRAAAADGVELRIVSGFRTYQEQEYLYECYLTGNCNDGNLAARPGYSNHQSGHALDLNSSSRSSAQYQWLAANADRFGFTETVEGEPWHWEWWEGGPGEVTCDPDHPDVACRLSDGTQGHCTNTRTCSEFGPNHTTTSGLCPGDSDVKCCTGSESCQQDDRSGVCLPTETCLNKGESYEAVIGLCPGPSGYRCCLARPGAPTPPDDNADAGTPPPPEGGAAGPEQPAGDGAANDAGNGDSETPGGHRGGSGGSGNGNVVRDADRNEDPGCHVATVGASSSLPGFFGWLVALVGLAAAAVSRGRKAL